MFPNWDLLANSLIRLCSDCHATRHMPHQLRISFILLCREANFEMFVGASSKLRKATLSFVEPVCPSMRKEKLGSHYTDFHEISYLSISRKLVERVKFSLILTRITSTLHKDRYNISLNSS